MKRIVTGLAAILLSLSAFAQGGIPILDRVPGHRVLFHYTYSLSQGGRPMTQVTDGDVVVEDNAYLLSGLGLEVRSDGTTRWSLDRAAEELLIETVEKEDLFTNPALFINSYKGYMDKIRVNGSSGQFPGRHARPGRGHVRPLRPQEHRLRGQARKKRLHAEREIASRFVCDHRSSVDSSGDISVCVIAHAAYGKGQRALFCVCGAHLVLLDVDVAVGGHAGSSSETVEVQKAA